MVEAGEDYNIQNNATLHLLGKLKGGHIHKPYRVRTMTMNIGQGTKEKIHILMEHLYANNIDVAFITETRTGTNLTSEIKGYRAHQTPMEHAGAVLLLRENWNHSITANIFFKLKIRFIDFFVDARLGTSCLRHHIHLKNIIQKGRVIALTLKTKEGAEIVLTCLYQKTG